MLLCMTGLAEVLIIIDKFSSSELLVDIIQGCRNNQTFFGVAQLCMDHSRPGERRMLVISQPLGKTRFILISSGTLAHNPLYDENIDQESMAIKTP
jgi:hypothetical protein